ncbi:MAG: taurine ABC transporter substrate-binding protein [Microbacterium sp.]
MTRNKTLAATVTALAGIALLSGCVTPQSSGNGGADAELTECPVDVDESIDTEVDIAYQPIPNGDLIVKDLGWLETCMPNATINWSQYSSGADVVQAFGANSADIGLVGSGPAVKLLAEPLALDVKTIWIFDVIGAAESLITQEELSSVEDLKGKTVAVPFGSTAHYSLTAALDEAGMTAKDIDLINLEPDAMLAAWERGEIDAAWVWNPTLAQLEKEGHLLLTAAETAEAGRATYDLAGGTTEFVEGNPEFMDVWTAAQNAASDMIQNDTDTAAESVAIELGVSVDEVKTQFEGYEYPTASEQLDDAYFGGGLGDTLLSTAEFLTDQGEVDGIGDEKRYAEAPWSDAIENAAQ